MKHELLLKGGHVIDPQNSIDEPMDVAISDGKIAAVKKEIKGDQAHRVLDVKGLYVTPGLIDLHTHLYATPGNRDAWAGDNSVFPDGFSFRTGVTTMVDAGSSGWRNFEDFRYRVIDRAQTRVFAMINITGLGMITDIPEQNVYDMDPELTAEMAKKHSDVIVAVKTAHYFGPEWVSIERAIAAGELADLPIVVDVGYFRRERPYYEMVTSKLRPGDMATHMFRAPIPFLGPEGRLLNYLHLARQRGVLFDVGHGGGSFVFRNAVPSVEQGFYPDTISSDLHTDSSNGSMMDLPTVMSKFLAMGMPLWEIIKTTTSTPAKLLKHPELGHLGEGAVADLAVLNLLQGNFAYYDAEHGRLEASQRLFNELTIKDGTIVWDWNARGAVDYRKLGETYGVRDCDEVVFPTEEHLL